MAHAPDGSAPASKNAQEPSQHDAPCQKGEDDRTSDLCAQWKAAEAAASSADAAWLFGYVGSAIGALTLFAAVAAAIYAARAAKAAIGAERSFREAERAVLRLEPPHLYLKNGEEILHVRFKNVGRGNAFIERFKWQEISEPVFPKALTNDIEAPTFITNPGADGSIRMPSRGIVAGVIEYRTFPGETWRAHFCISVNHLEPSKLGGISGNALLRRCKGMPKDT